MTFWDLPHSFLITSSLLICIVAVPGMFSGTAQHIRQELIPFALESAAGVGDGAGTADTAAGEQDAHGFEVIVGIAFFACGRRRLGCRH